MNRAVAIPIGVAILGAVLAGLQVAIDPTRALFAYAAGFDFAITIALGALLFVFIAQTAGARWFVVLAPITNAIAATLPIFPLLFLPIALRVHRLYPWAGDLSALDPEGRAWAAHARPWLNVPFFLVRSYVYLFVWSALAILRRRPALSAVGLPILAFTLTFAGFDWVMSMSTRWSSDMLGVYLFTGAFGGAIGTTAFVAWRAKVAGLLPPGVRRDHFHALGRILLCATILWAYIGFCQFVLVWMADMARESSFYAARGSGAWGRASAALFLVHFAVPFFLLLSRPLKRSPMPLALVGAWLVGAHALDIEWLVLPPLDEGMRVLDAGCFLGLGGITAAFGAWRFLATPAVPLTDPALAEALQYESP